MLSEFNYILLLRGLLRWDGEALPLLATADEGQTARKLTEGFI